MIYFDNAATYLTNNQDTLEVFLKAQKQYVANSSSSHRLGYLTNRALDEARSEILKALGLDQTYEVIFNSGASEGINHAIKGYALKNKSRGNEIIAFKNEHPAVIETLASLTKLGFKINYVNANGNGEIIYDEIKQFINEKTIMVVVMSVNNEVGAINDLAKIKTIIKGYPKCVFFSDVTQSIGKIKTPYQLLDMFTFSSHKFGGIIGSGALVKKKKILLEKLIDGGAQENNLRSGTVPTSLALSTTYALNKAMHDLSYNEMYVNALKDELIIGLENIEEVEVNSYNDFPYIVNFSLKSKKASVVIEALSSKEIYVSSLSACHAKSNVVSSVLLNMKKDKRLAENSIRVSFSNINTSEEVKTFLKELKNILGAIR